MKPRSRRAKMARLQKWVAKMIGQATNLPVGKDCHIESREAGQNGPDVRLSPLAQECFPFVVECENAEAWHLKTKIRQVQANLRPGTDWLCFFKSNGVRPVVALDAELFFEIWGGKK